MSDSNSSLFVLVISYLHSETSDFWLFFSDIRFDAHLCCFFEYIVVILVLKSRLNRQKKGYIIGIKYSQIYCQYLQIKMSRNAESFQDVFSF